MIIDVISLCSNALEPLKFGIVGRAQKEGLIKVNINCLYDFIKDKDRIDSKPYSGGPGVLIKYDPLYEAMEKIFQKSKKKIFSIYLSPRGRLLKQEDIEILSKKSRILVLCGRYEGIDNRFIEKHIDEEYSIGDYVVSCGELSAIILIDAITRIIPGSIGNNNSKKDESLTTGLLDYPQYTKSKILGNQLVPKVLLSGNHKVIHLWKKKKSIGYTWKRRPDLIKNRKMDKLEVKLLFEHINENTE